LQRLDRRFAHDPGDEPTLGWRALTFGGPAWFLVAY
jgi:hypothetical protein